MDPGGGLGRERHRVPRPYRRTPPQYRQSTRKYRAAPGSPARVTSARTNTTMASTNCTTSTRRSGGGRARCTVSPCTPVPDRGPARCWPPALHPEGSPEKPFPGPLSTSPNIRQAPGRSPPLLAQENKLDRCSQQLIRKASLNKTTTLQAAATPPWFATPLRPPGVLRHVLISLIPWAHHSHQVCALLTLLNTTL